MSLTPPGQPPGLRFSQAQLGGEGAAADAVNPFTASY